MSKIFIAIVTLLLAITTLFKKNFTENFGMLQQTVYGVQDVYVPPSKNKSAQFYSLPQNLVNMFGTPKGASSAINNSMISTRNLEGVVPPRFLSSGLGSYINFNLPDTKNMAMDSKNPMSFANHIDTGCTSNSPAPSKENYVPRCQKGGINNQNEENYEPSQVLNDLYPKSSDVLSDIPLQLPVASMGMYQVLSPSGGTTEDGGNQPSVEQPVITTRLVYSNTKSYLRGLADQIRGDLAIEPDVKNWFQVAAKPSYSLNPGALSVMGGEMSDSQLKMATLLANTKGVSSVFVGGQSYNNEVLAMAKNNYQSALQDLNLSTNITSSLGPVANGQPIYATAYP